MDFTQFLGALRRRWLIILLTLVIALAAAAAFTFTRTPKYESKAQLFLSVDVTNTSDAYAALLFQSNRAASYATLAQSTTLAERVVTALNLTISPEELASRISAQVIPDTALIQITVTDTNPRNAQVIADVATKEFTSYLAALETPVGGNSQITMQVSNPASYNPDPVSPRIIINFVLAGAAGLLLGVALALARDLLDNTIKTPEDLTDTVDAPVMAGVGHDRALAKHPLLTDINGYSPRSEAFRVLRTNLQYLDLDNPAKSLVITSSVAAEGKTSTATNLAIALAQAGRRVLLVDSDLRRPRAATLLGLESRIGLTTVLVGRSTLAESIQTHEPSGVHVLASGPTPPNPSEILQAQATHDLIRELTASYDHVIIDAPPLLPVADAAILGAVVDGTLLVTRWGKTQKDEITTAAERITRVGGRLSGIVLNMIPRRTSAYYYYYYYEESSRKGSRSGDRKRDRT